jgi:LDH2 family malate/lactate/ureidoglycolate dehydrogenase
MPPHDDAARNPMEALPRYPASGLHDLCRKALEGLGVPREEASVTADVLLFADLHGIDSHGLAQMATYERQLRNGAYVARRSVTVVRESAATALLDGGGGLGHPAGVRAMELAIAKAGQAGAGIVAVRRSHHFGAAGYYAQLALDRDMVGFAITNAGPAVLPTFGLQPRLGTNPIALAVPAASEPPFLLDMATSAKAIGKLDICIRQGKSVPEGWVMSADGTPCHDPREFVQARSSDMLGGLLPLGGAGEQTSGYKGFGLGLGVELLALIAGDTPGPFMNMWPGCPEPTIAHLFMAIKVDAFRPAAEFKSDVDGVLANIKASPKAPGQQRIYTAGEKEFDARRDREPRGIPLDPRVVDALKGIAGRLGLEFPAPCA